MNALNIEEGGMRIARESVMGIATDLTVAVLAQLSIAETTVTYRERIGRLYRAVLREVELGQNEILTTRGVEL
jgi:hypothetical protein